MLLHSREGSGEHRPVDINALVEESLNLAYHGARAEKQGFEITLERSGGCPLRLDGFRRSSPHPRPGGQAHRNGIFAVRIPLTTSGGYLVHVPAEWFAGAPDAVHDNR